MAGRKPIPLAQRFASKHVEAPGGCWLWIGAKNAAGYGLMELHGLGRRNCTGAHRVSWMLHRGEIPARLCVLHRCDTPACVNPDHLFLGTHKDNVADAIAKGRMDRDHFGKNVRGVTGLDHPASRYDAAMRARVIEARYSHCLTHAQIAEVTGVPRHSIMRWCREYERSLLA